MANRILRSVGYGDLQGEVEKSLARITWLNLCLRLPGDMAGNQGLDAGSIRECSLAQERLAEHVVAVLRDVLAET